MSRLSSRFIGVLAAVVLSGACAGCQHVLPWEPEMALARAGPADAGGWGAAVVVPVAQVVEDGEAEGPYRLDSGDRLRIFVYGHPNLSRRYTVDQSGMVSVPLIGDVPARGRTTRGLGRAIAQRLGTQYVRDPQVTVDIAQNRPFFILGEVRNAGQYPYVGGMTVQAAVAIAGGIPEIVAGTGTGLLPPEDSGALTEAMLEVLRDPPAARARSLRLQQAVGRRFTVAAMADDVLDFYDTVAADAGRDRG